MSGPLDTANAAWGEDLPDWVRTLAIECGKSSQSKVAARLERSTTLVSQVLNNKYNGDLPAIEARVRGLFEHQTLICPALGEMPLNVCQDWIAKARVFQTGNPLRVRMYRACRACPRFHKEESDGK